MKASEWIQELFDTCLSHGEEYLLDKDYDEDEICAIYATVDELP